MQNIQKHKLKKRGIGAFLALIGFILSPLTWWNDMVINLPLAFVFAYVTGKLLSFFIPVNLFFFFTLMAIGYFLSNFIGFLLMHKGVLKFCQTKNKTPFCWKKNLLYSLLALVLVVLSVQIGLLDLGETEKLMASVLKVSFLK